MSLDRVYAKKQYLDMASQKRESNFNKVPQASSNSVITSEPKSLKKPGSS